MKMTHSLLKAMLNPWVILAGIVAGALVGFSSPAIAAYLSPLGSLYSSLLQMCVIPILLTAVISSLSRLLMTGRATHYVTRLFIIFTLGLLLASGVGVLVGVIGQPGASLQQSAQATLGTIIFRQEIEALEQTDAAIAQPGLLSFFDAMVPDNIFASLSSGDQLAVLFFSMLVGIALGSTGASKAQPVLVILETLYETFIKIVGWLMYALPLGLFFLAAGQVSQLGVEVLGAVVKLVVLVYLCAALLLLVYTGVIWLKVGGPLRHTLNALHETMVVAIGTASSFASIPSALRGLKEELHLSKDVTDLVLPLGITLNPPGSVCHFALASLFIAQLYSVELGLSQYVLILVGAIFAGIGASGAPGIAALSMIAIVLQPLRLPVDVALILLAAIDPIVDPLLTVVNVQANCATTALIARHAADSVSSVDG